VAGGPAQRAQRDWNAEALAQSLRAAFAAHADAKRAAPMQTYMKSDLPFYGIQAPLRRRLQATVFAAMPCRSGERLAEAMLRLWRGATHREERYAAIELPDARSHRKLLGVECLPACEEMIRTGAWWDYCDAISAGAVAALLRQDPAAMRPVLLRWACSGDLWLARASILCQRSMGPAADAHLLYRCILPSLDSPEFFLRKGIGWALRQRARHAPDEVRAFCREYHARLSPLTRREALRKLPVSPPR